MRLLVLDAYFAVGPVFAILKTVRDTDAPARTGRRCHQPRQYGEKLALIDLFDTRRALFAKARIEIYGQAKEVAFLCLDLLWKPVGEKVRFVLVADGAERFILMGSDLTLGARDMILATAIGSRSRSA